MDTQSILQSMSLQDKIKFVSGNGLWHTKGFEKYGIPPIRLNDGPHGLRKQEEKKEKAGVNESVQATCFPTASAAANSWDRNLLRRMGEAIGEEACEQEVHVVLGPGVNIKRNPLCGRNFEYYSEDPYLTGELGASFVQGVQDRGAGTSLKHFAANNQENLRMIANSIVDERALREIYLSAFEKVVKTAHPATVMCAYNRLNGIYCSDNRWLLTEVLRKEWGFNGLVMSDWGAVNDRVEGVKAGLDLEMPGSNDYYAPFIEKAIQEGRLSEVELDVCVERLLNLVFSVSGNEPKPFDRDQHNQLAREVAAKSAVLLKNEGALPLSPAAKIAVVGRMAKYPRYQGSGSSHVNPIRLTSAVDALQQAGVSYQYFEGYSASGSNPALITEAVEGVKGFEAVVIFAGLPESYESEGFDRDHMQMPPEHNRLISEICKVHNRVIVVLSAGSPVEMPWIDEVEGLLHLYLAGQACGLAAVDLLFGKANPSGKLAESYPIHYQDTVTSGIYGKDGKRNLYKESLFVGYRYYDSAGVDVLFPFGYGLSYTKFLYTDLRVNQRGLSNYEATVTIENIGDRDGEEIVQLYTADLTDAVYRPQKELKGFEKVFLHPGEKKTVTFLLDHRSFAFYNIDSHTWNVPTGDFEISIGTSSREIKLKDTLRLAGDIDPHALKGKYDIAWYRNPVGEPSDQDFARLYGSEIPEEKSYRKGEYTTQNTIEDIRGSLIGKIMVKYAEWFNGKSEGGVDYNNPTFRMRIESSLSMPIIRAALMSNGSMSPQFAEGMVEVANGHLLRGLRMMFGKKTE